MRAEAIQEAIDAISAVKDPADRVLATTDALRVLHDGTGPLAALRRAALIEMHDAGMSYRQISAALKESGTEISFARVGQIISGEPTGVGVPGRKSKKAPGADPSQTPAVPAD